MKRRIISTVLYPIIKELPFFLMYFVLMANYVIRLFRCKLLLPEYQDAGFTYWDLFFRATLIMLCGYLFSWLLVALKKKWVKVVAYSIVIGLFAVDFFLSKAFGLFISPFVLVLIAETNTKESAEFINTFMGVGGNWVVYALVLLVIVITAILEKFYYPRIYQKLNSLIERKRLLSYLMVSVFSVLFVCGLYASGTYVRLFQCNDTDELSDWEMYDTFYPLDPFSNTMYALRGVYLADKEMKSAIEDVNHNKNAVSCREDSLTVVLVIGESYIKSHAALYGYALQTTPNMCQEIEDGNLFAFRDVISPFNSTSNTMKNMLCCNSISEGESWFGSAYFPALFADAGYKVMFWDNQKDWNAQMSFSFALNTFLYNENMNRLYAAVNDVSYEYDDELVHSFFARNPETAGNQLVLFHLLGQHSDADCRYPAREEFMQFTADSIKRNDSYLDAHRKTKIANYDNATYYNDYVIKHIMDHYRSRNAVMLYLSDHGEEIYDYRDSEGRRRETAFNRNLLKYQYDIPFLLWCSPVYQQLHPGITDTITQALDRPFMIDNVCQVLFHLGGISGDYYIPQRDLLSSKYRTPKRLVERVVDYDAEH